MSAPSPSQMMPNSRNGGISRVLSAVSAANTAVITNDTPVGATSNAISARQRLRRGSVALDGIAIGATDEPGSCACDRTGEAAEEPWREAELRKPLNLLAEIPRRPHKD